MLKSIALIMLVPNAAAKITLTLVFSLYAHARA